MILGPREHEILRLVSDFKLVSRSHIQRAVFAGLSRSPADRALDRLLPPTTRNPKGMNMIALHKLRRPVLRGGAENIYKLTGSGFTIYPPSPQYRRAIGNPDHCLAVADIYLTLMELERTGRFTIDSYRTEPRHELGGVDLRPDLHANLTTSTRGLHIDFEADLGTESLKQVKGKLDAVHEAYKAIEAESFPLTVWVCLDGARALRVKKLIAELPERVEVRLPDGTVDVYSPRDLFAVATFETLAKQLSA